MMTLKEIGLKHGTDKATYHGYLDFYESILNPIKAKIVNMLELGIFHGQSLLTWHEFLDDANIYALDHNLDQIKYDVSFANIEKMDLSKSSQLAYYIDQKKYNNINFDFIIDDASHITSHQILAFKTLWPYLNAGGVYIIEDCHTSFLNYGKLYGADGTWSPFIDGPTIFDFMESENFNNLKVASFAFYQNDKNGPDDSLTLAITKAPYRINETRWNKKR